MSNINLNLATEESTRSNPRALGMGSVVSFIILILIIVAYGSLMFLKTTLSSRIEATQTEYDGEYKKFVAGKGSDILDFENRSAAAKKIMDSDRSTVEVLGKIEESILPSVYLNSFKYDKTSKEVALECIGDSFNAIAKQILSFKQNDYFSEVIPGSSAVESESNSIKFELNLKIK